MRNRIKKFMIAGSAFLLCLGTGTSAFAEEIVDTANMDTYKIGVVVYSIQDEQVVAFREYLRDYIGVCFPDVEFIYSGAVNNEEEEMQFLQDAADAGVKGILSFSSYNLEEEVDFCAENEIYYIRAASSESDENFAKVEDNPYFLGCVGPGIEMEYEAGYDMGKYFTENKETDEYFILSGGAAYGVEMHLQRSEGILDAIEEAYSIDLGDKKEILSATEPVSVEEGGVKLCIVPGFLDSELYSEAAKEAYQEHPYKQVLSVIPISNLADTVADASLGVIDCYSTENLILYTQGTLQYLTGKFSSTVAPSFAAMYNALTGYAEDFREDGKAFSLTQGFWTSTDRQDYEEKYALSCSIAMNAYSAEDIASVCKKLNPDATMGDLRGLSDAYTFEDAAARRGLQD